MKFVVRKEVRVNEGYHELGGVWYDVTLKNLFLRWFYDFLALNYLCFKDLKEAKECARLKTIGKWDYIKERRILNGKENIN